MEVLYLNAFLLAFWAIIKFIDLTFVDLQKI